MHTQYMAHLLAIRRTTHDGRTRLIAVVTDLIPCTLGSPAHASVRVQHAIVCARSEQCSMCDRIIQAWSGQGFRVADVGVLLPVEVDRVPELESTAPAASQ